MEYEISKDNRKWLISYLDNCKRLNKSPHTLKNYSADIEKFLSWYEIKNEKKLSKIEGKIIGEYKDFLTNGGVCSSRKKWWHFIGKKKKGFTFTQTPLAVTSRRRHISSIKNFFEYLKQFNEDKGRIFLINPVKTKLHAIKLKDQDVEHTVVINKQQWETLSESIHRTKERLAVALMYYGGLRLSELTRLKLIHFDSDSKTLRFYRKGGYHHILKLQEFDYIYSQLRFHFINKNESDYIFSNIKGKPLSSRTLYAMIKKMLLKAGLPRAIGPHSFRKACATNLYIKSKDLLYVRDYLNHKDAKVTQTYIDRIEIEKEREKAYH